jgi:hypothetical protein
MERRKYISEASALLALSLNYMGAYIIAILWKWPSEEMILLFYILAVFIVSLLFGSFIIDLKRSTIYTAISAAIGMFLAVTLMSAPPIILSLEAMSIDATLTMALTVISKLFLVGVTFAFIGTIVGCIIGDMLA